MHIFIIFLDSTTKLKILGNKITTFFVEVHTFAKFCLITFKKIRKQPLEVFYEKGVLKNFAIFTGKHQCWSLFLILNIARILRAPILNICEWLVLKMYSWNCKKIKICCYGILTLHLKNRIFQHQHKKQAKIYISLFFFMIGFLWSLDSHSYNISLMCCEINSHCVKCIQLRSFFWSVFFRISLRIESECGKKRARKNSVFGHFLLSAKH